MRNRKRRDERQEMERQETAEGEKRNRKTDIWETGKRDTRNKKWRDKK